MHRAILVSQSLFWSLVLGLVLPSVLQDVPAWGQEAKKAKETKEAKGPLEAKEIKVAKVVVVDVGETKKVPLDQVKVVDITVENTKVLDKDIRVLDSSLLITGKLPGRTYIHMTDDKKDVVTYEIIVPQRPLIEGEKEIRNAAEFGLNLIQIYPGEKKQVRRKHQINKILVDDYKILLAYPTRNPETWELYAGRFTLEEKTEEKIKDEKLGTEKTQIKESKKNFAYTRVFLINDKNDIEVLHVQIIPREEKKIKTIFVGLGEAKMAEMSNKQKIINVEVQNPNIVEEVLSKGNYSVFLKGLSPGRSLLVLTDEENNRELFDVQVGVKMHRMHIWNGAAPLQPFPVIFKLDEKGNVLPTEQGN